MGNKIARTTQVSATEYYLHDLPSSYNLVLKEVLGRGRFFKSILCKHDEGLVIVKVYFKRGDFLDLREYERRLVKINDTFSTVEHSHVWPFQFWQETDKAAYLLRQFFFNNLHDRLSTRPFLSLVEKKWLAFQLLLAVKQCHEKNICHGDIKCENVLVTSWNWLYLADFASFKPTYIPYDDPSDFSYFFDTGGRRLCYLAPERFYENGDEMKVAQDAPLKPSMDIFAVGCVIAELFLGGQTLFELSQLLAYRRGQYDPSQHLEKIPDLEIRKMILHMIQLEPEARLSAESYLHTYAGVVFPNYFSPFLHNLYCCWNPLPSDMRVATCQGIFHEILKQMMDNKPSTSLNSMPPNARDIGEVQETLSNQSLNKSKDLMRNTEYMDRLSVGDQFKVLNSFGMPIGETKQRIHSADIIGVDVVNSADNVVSPDLSQSNSLSPSELLLTISDAFRRNQHPFLKKLTVGNLNVLMSDYDSQSDTFGLPFLPLPEVNMRCEGMVLIASLLCSCIRNIKLPHLRRGAILLLKSCSLYIDDEDRLQRVLPYVIVLLSDPAAIVRCAALETLCDILPLVRDFPPSDGKIFPEYIFPMLSMLPDDPEESVRICYASNIAKLALTAYGFLIHSVRLSEAGVLNELSSQHKSISSGEKTGLLHKLNGDVQLADLRKNIAEIVQELVMGPKQTPNVRRALLEDIGNLCFFFGQRQSNDFLLPILPAFLNDQDEQLRSIFFEKILYVCFFVGQRSVEEYLLPYIEQALIDPIEAVIVNALDCLSTLCKSGFLRKRVLLQMIERAFPLLCYPCRWVRRAVVTFVAASSESLGAVDSYVFLAPVIRPLLRRQPASIASETALLSCLKPPVSRDVVYQVLENARRSDMLERQRKIWYNSSPYSKTWETVDLFNKTTADLSSMESWPDEQLSQGDQKATSTVQQQQYSNGSTESDDKLKTSGGLRHNYSGMFDLRDPSYSEKLQFSGFISPQVGGHNSSIDKSSEGIPLYSFSMDKRSVASPPMASESSLQVNSLGTGSLSVPWMDSMSKSFNLGSSVPVPKLISGSFTVGNNSKQFYRVVHEPENKENDQTASISSKFQDIGLSSSIKGSSTTSEDATSPADLLGSPSFSRTSVPDSGWKPRGVLVAHLQEHRSAVNDIASSSDHSFFVSASDDSTVKVWDSRRLEKDISFRSRLTYSLQGSRALCTTVLRNSTQVVVGASDGMMHMFSIDYISKGLGTVVEKYSGIVDVKKKDIKEGAILTLMNYTADNSANQMVMYSTQNCGIHLWDVRSDTDAWTLKAVPEEGYASSLVASPCGNWFVSGSSRGVLTLWDLRFLVPVNSWQYSVVCPIEKMCLYIPPPNVSTPYSQRPLIYVAAGCNEVSLWNAENGSSLQVLRAANYENDAELTESSKSLAKSSHKSSPKPANRRNTNSKYRIEELNEPPPRLPGVRSLLPLPGGDLLTGGTDLKIRRWDHTSPERSYCVCGPNLKGVRNDDFYEIRSSFGVQVVQETKRRPLTTKLTSKAVLAAAATDTAGCHRDSVTSLATVKLNQRLLISSSRDGAIKVWR